MEGVFMPWRKIAVQRKSTKHNSLQGVLLKKENIDYGETISPTARLTSSVRMLMDVAVHENLILHQMDVTTAYLHADIDYELYVEQPSYMFHRRKW